ncbi:dihydroxyacetone kinase subunit DhaL [Oscillospiraceae bacterium PP1C4]
MKTITVTTLQRMMIHVADEIIANESYLTEVDTVIGDGDHGIGMKRGFQALKNMLEKTAFDTVDFLLKAVGIELVKTMGGASGVIFGTMFIGGLNKLSPSDTISLDELAAYFDEGVSAIKRRGKAKAGEKTMLDALIPAVESLKQSAEEQSDMQDALEKAYTMAEGGVEASKSMKSRVGRSKNFQDATLGLPDPGAISTSLIFKALFEGVNA